MGSMRDTTIPLPAHLEVESSSSGGSMLTDLPRQCMVEKEVFGLEGGGIPWVYGRYKRRSTLRLLRLK